MRVFLLCDRPLFLYQNVKTSVLDLEDHACTLQFSFKLFVLQQNENTLCPRLRNAKVEDLWSLTNFFGFATETFVLAVNILDRFLALMKVFMMASYCKTVWHVLC